jgi:LacI family transcriptional regulator
MKATMTTRYTIEDIAREAGVSRGTVSRVLNNFPNVSDETRQIVQAVIDRVQYRPSFSARHMRTASSNLVGFGLLSNDVITTPYAVEIIAGAQEALWELGKVMMIVSADNRRDWTEASLEALLERRVEGLIYAAMYHRPVTLPLQQSETPIVLVNCFTTDGHHTSVVPDEVLGGCNATSHLLAKGHRRIGFINLGDPKRENLPPPLAASEGRLSGYKQALEAYGVPFDGSLVHYTDQTTATNYRLCYDLLTRPKPPTAIFCGNDRVALACYAALAELGLKVPKDVAVIGFDNQVDIALGMWPSLTTIQLPHYEMGKWAVQFLMSGDAVRGQIVHHKLPCVLVERDST